jgi:hypothetical protein
VKLEDVLSAESIREILDEFGMEAETEMSKWTDEDFAIAYDEARKRLLKPDIPISVKVKMNN